MGTTQNKLVTSHQYNKRNKQAVQVLNKVEYDSDGNPIGLCEDPSNPTSANFGTPREPRRGGCYRGDGVSLTRIDIPPTFYMSDRKIFCVSYWAYYSTNITYSISRTVLSNRTGYQDGQTEVRGNSLSTNLFGDNSESIGAKMIYDEWHHVILQMDFINGIANSYINGKQYSQRNISLTGYPRTDVSSYVLMKTKNRTNELLDTNDKIFGFCIQDKFLSNQEAYSLYKNSFLGGSYILKYNCSENSGSICYDSSGNGHHGQIVNAITTTPEENPNSIHQYQDVYSFENEEGFSDLTVHTRVEVPDLVSTVGLIYHIKNVALQDIRDFSNPNRFIPIGFGLKYKIYVECPNQYTVSHGGYSAGVVAIGKTNEVITFTSYTTGQWALIDLRSINNEVDYNNTYLTIELIDYNRYFPKDSSITLPPFKDVLGNNLQYVGKVPGKAKFVNSSCFLSDGSAYLSVDVLTTDTITAHTESEVPVCTTDGRLAFPNVGGKYFGITIERGGSVIARLPLCEPIVDPSNHTYHDVSGNGNHATLVNGTLANEGKQDKFHYLQKGFNFAKIGVNRLPYTDDILNYWTLSRYAEILETGLPDPLGGNKAIRIKYQTQNSPDKNRTVLTKPLTRTYPGSWTPRGNYTISLYVKNAIPGELNSFSLIIRAATKSSDLIATDSWNRFSFYGNHNVDIYSGNGLAIDSLDSSFDLIIFGFQMELGNNLSPYEPTMFIGKRDGYKPKLLNIDKDAEMSENILIPQDSHTFLNTGENGTELEAYDYPALKQADKDDNFWYIGDAGVRRLSHYELAIENLMSDKIFLDTNNNSNR